MRKLQGRVPHAGGRVPYLKRGAGPGIPDVVLTLVFRLIESVGIPAATSGLGAGLLVRLRPEHVQAYPWMPGGVWLRAHRRDGDEEVIWLDRKPDPRDAEHRPLLTRHVEILERIPDAAQCLDAPWNAPRDDARRVGYYL